LSEPSPLLSETKVFLSERVINKRTRTVNNVFQINNTETSLFSFLYVIICKRDADGGEKVNEINKFQEPGSGQRMTLISRYTQLRV
jgi:hypothetical protein